MKINRLIIFVIAIIVSINVFGQIEKTEDYSIAKNALIIDSLENQLVASSNIENSNIIFDLALLYWQIDPSQSKHYSINYIGIDDSISSDIKRNIIYGLLAQISEEMGNLDSSYYYLSVQSLNLDKSYHEQRELLEEKYLGTSSSPDEDTSTTYFGLSQIQFIVLVGLVILLLIELIYILYTKQKFKKLEAESNQKLEIANTKFKEFNDSVEQAVANNTKSKSIELDESNNVNVELRKSLKKSEESNYLKNAFMGSMSHQIRTPLSGIMGFSDLLEVELAVMGNEDLYEYAKNIRESGSKLMNLITNIIDISSIEANILELNITSCDLNEIFKEVESNYLLKAKEKGLVYKTKLDGSLPKINADASSLIKALNVVMDNAIKYTNKGFVTISTSFNRNNNTATIEIKDKGVGIDEETLKLLFASFEYKKHGSSLTYQGNGLGLILAHRLIDLMNSELEITSKIGIGTNVSITIPCCVDINTDDDSTNTSKQEASIVSAPEFGRVKIFIVEDDRMNRLVLEKMLKKSGEITTAVDGKDTLKKVEKNNKSGELFDVMLFDINLPAPWDGIKLMHEIKKKFPAYKSIPFIAQTAYAMSGDKDVYLDAGFNDYISKPIIKTELLTMIQKQLELTGKKAGV